MTDVHFIYADPAIAAKQRAVVTPQLRELHHGKGQDPILFRVVGEMLREIIRVLPAPISLLDAGCGSAYYSEVIKHYTGKSFTYTGVDYNSGMVALAHEHYPSLDVRQGDLCSLDFRSSSFKVVFSGACIAHIKSWKKALSELARVTGDYLLLHRNPIYLDRTATTWKHRNDYDVNVIVHQFNERELLGSIPGNFRVVMVQDVCKRIGNTVTRSYLLRRRRGRRRRRT